MSTDKLELSSLPKPQLIEPLDYDADVQRRKDRLVEIYPEIAEWINNPGEPMVKQIEAAAYAELVERNRANKVFVSTLLFFATGAMLDHVADGYGVERLENENDEDFRRRIRISNRGSSSAGPDDWWRRHAMEAHERVEDVSVQRVPIGPENEQRGLVRLSILSKDPTGIPTQDVIDAVRAKVSQPNVRNTCSAVDVVSATSVTVDVRIKVWMRPDALPGVFENMESHLLKAMAENRRLGWDLTPSWIIATLHTAGVYRIEVVSPDAPVEVTFDATPVLGNIEITQEGYRE